MSRFTKQQLYDALQALPPMIKEIVLQTENADRFREIMQRHGLTVAQIAIVAEELAPVTVGLELPEMLPRNLKDRMPELSDEKLKMLAADIDVVLLKDIRAHIIELAHQKRQAIATPTMPSSQTSAPAAAQPAPVVRTIGTDIATIKSSGSVHAAPDTMRVKEQPVSPVLMPSQQQKPPSPVQGNTYSAGTDPYREPTK